MLISVVPLPKSTKTTPSCFSSLFKTELAVAKELKYTFPFFKCFVSADFKHCVNKSFLLGFAEMKTKSAWIFCPICPIGSKVSGKLPTLKPIGKVCKTQGFLSANVRFASSKRLITSLLETGSLSFLRSFDRLKGCTLMCDPDKFEAKKCSEFFPSKTCEIWFIASEIAAVVLLILTISPFNTLFVLTDEPVAKISNLPRSFCFPAIALT